ncbi:MAG: ParB/RepB/Spo0J family partition protein [Deltaproteobacteria bacterium]|nr:ParB/RepB/Spo0J family partition protein [Deltaproteobacteria bacterium]MBI3388699.1 ParB/RepB/Spo0J family partition protein [Deltaproteobacteria bacterium]
MKKSFAGKFDSFPIGTSRAEAMSNALGIERTQSLTTLSIDKIRPNPNQPRRHRSPVKFRELVESIRARGLLQPIRVREIKTNSEYEIIAGEGRWLAHKELGIPDIAVVIVRDQTPEQAYIDALIENIVREDLNPVDRAEALIQVRMNLGSPSWDELSKHNAIGLTKRQIFNLLGLKQLPEAVQEEIRSGLLTEKHGRALRRVQSTPELFEQAHTQMIREHLTGEGALDLVKTLKTGVSEQRLQAFNVNYRTADELIIALEAKLAELRQARQSKRTEDIVAT